MASVSIEGIFIQFPGNEILKTPFDLSCRFVPFFQLQPQHLEVKVLLIESHSTVDRHQIANQEVV